MYISYAIGFSLYFRFLSFCFFFLCRPPLVAASLVKQFFYKL